MSESLLPSRLCLWTLPPSSHHSSTSQRQVRLPAVRDWVGVATQGGCHRDACVGYYVMYTCLLADLNAKIDVYKTKVDVSARYQLQWCFYVNFFQLRHFWGV